MCACTRGRHSSRRRCCRGPLLSVISFFGVPLGTYSVRAEDNTGLYRTVGGLLEQPGQVDTIGVVLTEADAVPLTALAGRVLEGIKEGRFYLLSDEAWWQAANTRLEDIRLGRNPTFAPQISQ